MNIASPKEKNIISNLTRMSVYYTSADDQWLPHGVAVIYVRLIDFSFW